MFKDTQKFHSETLENLIHKSDSGQWSAINDINWNQTPIIPEGVTTADYLDMISQLYYGEILTIQVIARMIDQLTDFQAKRFLVGQMYEEMRHAEVYLKYISKIGELAPINEKLKLIFDQALNWKGSVYGLIVALNILFEGEALQQQQTRVNTLPCHLFKEIIKRITIDEARHASFGVIYLKEKLPSVPTTDKIEILKWVFSMWNGWVVANDGRYKEAAILQIDTSKFDSRLKIQVRMLENIGLLNSELAASLGVKYDRAV